MITARDIIEINIDGELVDQIKRLSRALESGGRSFVFKNRKERAQKIRQNQLTGQLGELATNMALFSTKNYFIKAESQANGPLGDGGNDILGATIPIDVKTFNINTTNINTFFKHRYLMVANEEYNPNKIYIGCAVCEAPSHEDESYKVYVAGWVWGRDLPFEQWEVFETGEKRENFRLPFGKLRSMKSIKWMGLQETRLA